MAESEVVVMPCLGRPFALGMLYDCRNDTVVPEMTLWDNVMLMNALDSKKQVRSGYEIITDDSLESKATNLDIDARVKLSCLSGLIQVERSAKYLEDHMSSMHQSRVCLKYWSTSRYDRLRMDKLQNVQYPSVFEKNIATHVVIGVQYGAETFFVFDRKITDEDESKVKAIMEKLVKEIPSAQVKQTERVRKEVKKYECRFYGDLHLPSNPTTFDSVVKIYNKLPELLKEGDSPRVVRYIPKKVWLYPLIKLNSNAAKVVHIVSEDLVSQAQKVIEDILELERHANDLLNTNVCAFFSAIQLQLSDFKEKVINYKMSFSQKLMHFLPRIRAGEEEESKLTELMKSKEASPFSSQSLSTWIEAKEEEISTLEMFLNDMQTVKSIEFVLTPYNLGVTLKDLDCDCVVCFSFKVTAGNDALLEQMEAYSQHKDIKPKDTCTNLWFRNEQLKSSLTRQVVQFTSFAKANEGKEKTKFIVTEGGEMEDNGAEILVYNNGVPEPFSAMLNPRLLSAPKTEASEKSDPASAVDCVKCCASKGNGKNKRNGAQKFKVHTKSDTGVSNTKAPSPYVKRKVREWEAKSTGNKPHAQPHQKSNVKPKNGAGTSHRDTIQSSKILTREILCPPDKLKVYKDLVTHCNVRLQWTKPKHGADTVKHYTISYRLNSTSEVEWKAKKTSGKQTSWTITDLQADKEYEFRVRAEYDAGASEYSDIVLATTCRLESSTEIDGGATQRRDTITATPSDTIHNAPLCKSKTKYDDSVTKSSTLHSPEDHLADVMKTASTPIKGRYPQLSLFKLPQKEICRISGKLIRKVEIGQHPNPDRAIQHRVLLVVGATGAGKSTLINGMVNYILGVEWKDDFRFKLIVDQVKSQTESVTSEITAYTIHHMEGSRVPYSITIVDTPGFGDTSGLERDKEIAQQIKEFFSLRDGNGIDHLDAIGFVTQSALIRLTPTQLYVSDTILSIFGNDVARNIFIMVTFCDGQKPPVIEAVERSNIPCNGYFKFNNSALYANNADDVDDDFNQIFWKMGMKSFKKFFTEFIKAQSVSLTLTRDVLEKREKLEVAIQGLQKQVDACLGEMNVLHQEEIVLQKYKAQISANKDFSYELIVPYYITIKLPQGEYATNCLYCHSTCHFPCRIPDDGERWRCAAMVRTDSTSARCVRCKERCSWDMHKNTGERFELAYKREIHHYEDLKAKFHDALSEKATTDKMIASHTSKFEKAQTRLHLLIKEVCDCLDVLNSIALKHNPLTQADYIQLLIDEEKHKKMERWQDRVDFLEQTKEQTLLLTKPGDIDKRIAEENRRKQPGWEQKVDKLEQVKRIKRAIDKHNT